MNSSIILTREKAIRLLFVLSILGIYRELFYREIALGIGFRFVAYISRLVLLYKRRFIGVSIHVYILSFG